MAGKRIIGFTLLEALLTVAVIGLIMAISAPVYQKLFNNNDLSLAVSNTAFALRRAQLMARQGINDDAWGVRLTSGAVKIFKGTSFSSRNQNYDEDFILPASVSFGGLTEIFFYETSGLPNATGSLSLISADNNVINLSINKQGTVSY
jgi:type II secretory pathway pseudopilin PulG